MNIYNFLFCSVVDNKLILDQLITAFNRKIKKWPKHGLGSKYKILTESGGRGLCTVMGIAPNATEIREGGEQMTLVFFTPVGWCELFSQKKPFEKQKLF